MRHSNPIVCTRSVFGAMAALLVWAAAGQANEEITVDLPGGVSMEMVQIEAGSFTMGSSYSGESATQHEVTLSRGFYLGKYEVTQRQWNGVMGGNPSYYAGDDRPVEKVSWEDAQLFVQTLNAAAGDSLYRLPTEAEWEYAARAGTTTRWYFGDDETQFGAHGWSLGNTVDGTHEVGMLLPNPWGLHDMYGNVWEWAQDWYGEDYFDSSPGTDPLGPAAGTQRVTRGGGFNNSDVKICTSAFRNHPDPATRNIALGFRLLRMETNPTAVTPQSWGQIKKR